MRYCSINGVADELGAHPSSLRRWEEHGLISPERATMGKTTLRIYDEETMRSLRQAKAWMDTGVTVAQAFAQAHDEIEQEGQNND